MVPGNCPSPRNHHEIAFATGIARDLPDGVGQLSVVVAKQVTEAALALVIGIERALGVGDLAYRCGAGSGSRPGDDNIVKSPGHGHFVKRIAKRGQADFLNREKVKRR